MQESNVDIIGDIHGCAEGLVALLDKLGYSKRKGVYQHASRRVIFLGDFIDRGPFIRETLHLVREMVEQGHAQAIMGNHEYNAITYMTPARKGSNKKYLREHTKRNTYSIQETLDQFKSYPGELLDFVDWFSTLPLVIEYDTFRVVHACWDHEKIKWLRERFPDARIDMDFIHQSAEMGTPEQTCIDRLISGTDLRLPNNEFMVSSDGMQRRYFRTKFWSHKPKIYGDIVFQPDMLPDHIHNQALSGVDFSRIVHYSRDEIPVFVGHYWLDGEPAPITDNVACLDYSAVKDGKMVSYRMDGEAVLHKDKFVWVELGSDLC